MLIQILEFFADKDNIIVSIRDNGDEFNPNYDIGDDEISPLKVIKSISKNIEYTRTLGFNRTIITL